MNPRENGTDMNEEILGTVQGHRDGHGFVVRDDGERDIYLPSNEMRAVLHKDRVQVRIARQDQRGRPEGRVQEIVERPDQPIIGRFLQESGVWLVAPEDKRYGQDILIPAKATGSATVGQVVVVKLTEAPALFGQPVGRIVEVLGEVDDPGMEIEIAVRKYGVPHIFSDACLEQAKALPEKVQPADHAGRIDLTDIPLVTIDGEDARDFDDAVYCEPAKIGRGKGWRLLVAIADVSHYVTTGSAIDVDAYDRATSVYFPRRVIPMLPEKLSNGLCSLNPDVDRMCMVCDMLITEQGEIHAYQFYPAVMHSHARFTYTEVAAILANTRGQEASKRKDRVQDLLNLHGVFQSLLKSRQVRGAVDFETTETQIVCDDNGRIDKIVPRTRNEAHKLIEEAMLAANVCSADFIDQSGQLGLFRVHDKPSMEKQEILRNYLKAMGVGMSISENPTTKEFQEIANATKDRPDSQQIHTMLLRSMMQAFYTPEGSGHFGLAFDAYTHFTSPIRRYPDLLVHRVIKAELGGTHYRLPNLPPPGEAEAKMAKRLASRVVPPDQKPRKKRAAAKDFQAWEAAGLHCSANERRADEASRDVEAWLKCKYMREHLGEEFSGMVSSVTTFGIFVTLDAMYVEGLVHITELGGDYFRFDEARQELRGERSGVRYGIGARVRVQVSRVDLDGRRIDFRLVRDGEDAPVQSTRAGNGAGNSGGKGAGKGNTAGGSFSPRAQGKDDGRGRRGRRGDNRGGRDGRDGREPRAPRDERGNASNGDKWSRRDAKSNRAQRNDAQAPAQARAPEKNASWKDRKEAQKPVSESVNLAALEAEYDRERKAVKPAPVVAPAPAQVPVSAPVVSKPHKAAAKVATEAAAKESTQPVTKPAKAADKPATKQTTKQAAKPAAKVAEKVKAKATEKAAPKKKVAALLEAPASVEAPAVTGAPSKPAKPAAKPLAKAAVKAAKKAPAAKKASAKTAEKAPAPVSAPVPDKKTMKAAVKPAAKAAAKKTAPAKTTAAKTASTKSAAKTTKRKTES
ncbi:ribonuclease R [Comamonas sp. Y33R10-2]|uniref:ribonuclease R n=1 Tax=Comamonas sp. Y33R10-2 TaxID=2853257 RepID=UPI0021068807|nr:ribonuclease R [Comamonas sp. Y33R10-2]